jgi:hypothetical protein
MYIGFNGGESFLLSLKIMAFCLSTLPAGDRCIVSAPRNCFEVSSAIHDFGSVVDCFARNFNGKKVLNAIKIGNDCFDVTITNYNHMGGRLVQGKTIRFTTTGTWVGEWLKAVGAKDSL